MAEGEHAIEAEGLVREYRKGPRAVDGIDLQVGSGEIYGFLGPNGAGKSTTVHMLTTLLPPTAGSARVGGYDVVHQGPQVRRLIGAALQEAALDGLLTGREHLRLQSALQAIPRAERKPRADELLERVGLDRRRRPEGPRVLRRDEASPRPRPGSRPPAADPVSRRADDGARRAEPDSTLGRRSAGLPGRTA